MLTSSFTGQKNYMRDLGELMGDAEAMKKLRQHHGGLGLPRAQADPDARGAGRAARDPLGAAAAPQLRVHHDRAHLEALADRAEGRRHVRRAAPSPTSAIRRRRRCRSTSASRPTTASSSSTRFMDGTCRVYDVSDPQQPKLVHEQKIGEQLNMVSQTWDGEARLLHVVAARELGQEGRGQRAVPEGLRLGREEADAALRRRLH